MAEEHDVIYDSPASQPDDEFWLEQGRKMVEGSLAAVREAARSLLTGLGALQGIYIGILGFAKFIPESMPLQKKFLFIIPMLFWLRALHLTLQVMMTRQLDLYLHSPDDIRKKLETVVENRQKHLQRSFWWITVGLITAFLLLGFHLSL